MKLTNTTYNVTVKAFNDSIIGDTTSIEAPHQIGIHVHITCTNHWCSL